MQFITWRHQEIILHDEPIPYMASEPMNETKGKNKGLTILSHPFENFSQFSLSHQLSYCSVLFFFFFYVILLALTNQ